VPATESLVRRPDSSSTGLPVSQWIVKLVSEITSMDAVPAYLEPSGLVPAISYFGASVA
jgi:hypothetical protein